jgi:hypothetical protein
MHRIVVAVYKKGDERGRSSFRCVLLSSSCRWLIPFVNRIVGDHRYGFGHSRSTAGQISAFVAYWKQKLECSEIVFQLFICMKKARDSARKGGSTLQHFRTN